MKALAIAVLLANAGCAHAYRSVIVDPRFAYYKDRSAESIVGEIVANDYQDVRLAHLNESSIDAELVKAFADAGLKVWLMTFVNGTYSTADLPNGWEDWRMKLKKGPMPAGFTYLCLNNPNYISWKKRRLTEALKAQPFAGVDLAEAFLPAYNGPESDVYGCLCKRCEDAFARMHPEAGGMPDFINVDSPRYYKTDKTLYEKWVGFRVSTVVNALDEIVNGRGGIREECPRSKVATWSLGLDVPEQLARLREWEALDGAAIVKRVRPDAHVIQTDWPDWIKADLPADYPLKYKPVADSIRADSPRVPLVLQTDIGSQKQMRRSRQWLRACEQAAKKIACESVTSYEYHLGDYIYTEPPTVAAAEFEQGRVKLAFNKRLDAASAANVSNYSLSSGKIDYARVDGNIVTLSVSGVEGPLTVQISGLSDDPGRRFFRDRPACLIERPIQVVVE